MQNRGQWQQYIIAAAIHAFMRLCAFSAIGILTCQSLWKLLLAALDLQGREQQRKGEYHHV